MNYICHNQSRATNVCKIKICVKTCSYECEVGDIATENENTCEEFLNYSVRIAVKGARAIERMKTKKSQRKSATKPKAS